MSKHAVIINGDLAGATRVLVNGKLKDGFTNFDYTDGKITLNFGDKTVEVASLCIESTKDWKCGDRVIDVAYGRTRTILTMGTDGAVLGGASGGNLKAGNVEVTFADLARNYILAKYASALDKGSCACEDED